MADLTDIIERLVKHDVDFVLVGGLAAVTHGSSMTTQDIDICCNFSPENLLRIQSSLADLNPVHRMTSNRIPLQLTEEYCKSLKNIYLDTDWGQLDCISEVLGLGNFDVVKRKSETIKLDGAECRILSIDALITAKKAMARPKDIETIKQLEVILHEQSSSDE